MTAIVGMEHEGRVYIGGDSAANQNGVVSLMADGKVFRRGEFVMGCAGTPRLTDLMRYVFEPPKPTNDVDAYMRVKFVPSVRECLKAAGYIGKDEDDESDCYLGSMLIGFCGRLYEIDGRFAVVRPSDGYSAVGSGCEVALGVLFATEGVKPEERIKMALYAAEHWTTDVRGPFTVLSTE